MTLLTWVVLFFFDDRTIFEFLANFWNLQIMVYYIATVKCLFSYSFDWIDFILHTDIKYNIHHLACAFLSPLTLSAGLYPSKRVCPCGRVSVRNRYFSFNFCVIATKISHNQGHSIPWLVLGVTILQPEVGNRKSATGSRQSEVGNRKSATGSRQSEVGNRKSEVNRKSTGSGIELFFGAFQ